MRILVLAAALALSACGQTGTAADAGCARTATREVTWTSESAPDVITAQSAGPSCAQAVVTFVARNSNGDPLWAFASTYYDMTMGGIPPEGAPPVSNEQMDAFLTGWANVSLQRSSELPEWRAGFDNLSASAQTFSYDTPFDRETYEMLRARNLQMICYAAAVEASQCLIIDPASHAPIMMVAYGP
jgi:Prokaryotic lipoprotein-attachment site